MGKIFKRYSHEEKKEFYKGWKASGLSQSDYCRENELSVTTFNSWLKKFSVGRERFIPVNLDTQTVEEVALQFLEIKLPGKLLVKLPLTAEVGLISRVIREISRCI